MTDLPPMAPCPSGKRGHSLASIVPEGEDASQRDMTLYCERCGATRRFPVNGPMLASRLDDASADEIRIAARTATSGGGS